MKTSRIDRTKFNASGASPDTALGVTVNNSD
jgi:hypothetical protein